MFTDLLTAQPPAIIVADGLTPPPHAGRNPASQSGTPLIYSPKPCSAVIDLLRIYLSARLANTVSLHGVFMDVLGMGVLITGDSGVGKSELALELISRGHGLVADDVVEMARIAPTTIEGRCPGMLRDFLEVRGLGLLNIRTIFGETASRRKMKLKLIVHLQKTRPRMPPPAARCADPGGAWRADPQGGHSGGGRPQPGGAARGCRAQHHPAVARDRQHAGFHGSSAARDA
jgi:HPr kinase/phosphorylase